MAEKGLIHIYCGEGKGKTTAALGLALRAAGCGFRVVVAQFLKSSPTGELNSLRGIENVTVLRGDLPRGFSWQLDGEQKAGMRREHDRLFEEAAALCAGGRTLLVLDEIIGAWYGGYIDRERVLAFLRGKPEGLEIVLTGRYPDERLCELADYITEMKKVRHPYDRGIPAREGIEK